MQCSCTESLALQQRVVHETLLIDQSECNHAEKLACLLAGVIEVLADALSDKNEKVRRRVMATLGELLFYVATQQQVRKPSI